MEKIDLPKSFIITADWHLRSTVPSCLDYTQDEWINLQKEAVNKVVEIAISKRIPIFIVGDIFHSDITTSFEMIQIVQDAAIKLEKYGLSLSVLFGNHDLKYHNSENVKKSPLGILTKSKNINLLSVYKNVSAANFDEKDDETAEYVFKHVLTMPSNEVPDFMDCETPESLLKKFGNSKLVALGDYHRYFEYHIDGRNVINPGCLTIQASDFEGYEPSVFVIDTDENTTERIEIGIDYVFNHNGEIKKELDQSIEDFVNHIKKQDVTLDYVTSLKNAASSYDEAIQKKILSWITRSGN